MSENPGYRLTYGMPREENGRRVVDSVLVEMGTGKEVLRAPIDLGPVPEFMLLPKLPLWKRILRHVLRWLRKKL